MSWDYAEQSKNAKAAGGPEEYVKKIHDEGWEEGKDEGRLEGSLFMLVVTCGGYLLYEKALKPIGKKAVEYVKKRTNYRKEQKGQAKIARDKLIQGINDYDASHFENDNEDSDNDKE